MAERVTIADGAELLWREKAMWLLLRRLGGKVLISDREWESVPERPVMVLDRCGGVMTWTAEDRSDEKGAGDG